MIHNRQLFSSPSSSESQLFRRVSEPSNLSVLSVKRRAYSLSESYSYCERMVQMRHDSLPVASRYLPESKRPHVFAVYAFARAADDFADEPEFHGQRQSALTNWEDELIRTFHGESDHPIFVALQQTVEACDLPITLFKDLLAGFRMDLAPRTFVSFDELRTYTRYVSEPLGELIVRVFGLKDPATLNFARDLSTGWQLVSFLQNLGRDLPRGRVYIPLEDLRHFGVLPEGTRTAPASAHLLGAGSRAWRDLLRFEVARARALLVRGRPLLDLVGSELRFELLLTYYSGQLLLDRMESLGDAVLQGRPALSRTDRARVLAKVAARRVPELYFRRSGEEND
ncbi:MAG TPA: squalene/phytoene synthase family protein [Pseudomonadota bacterium]|nr:squalene/phytoene synthase family protein [Pseudomonadota bacterium]